MGERARAALLAAIGALAAGAQPASAATKPAKGNGIKDGTLTLKDFKQGVLESKFFTEREVKQLLLKLEGTLSSKISAASGPPVVEHKVDLSPFARTADLTAGLGVVAQKIDSLSGILESKFFKQGAVDLGQDARLAAGDAVDAQQTERVVKVEQAVQRFGDGSVRSGRVEQTPEAPSAPLLVVEGTVAARPVGAAEEQRVGLQLTELSGADATVVGTRNGESLGPSVLKAGGTMQLGLALEGPTQFVLQVLSADGGLATLTVSSFAADGSVRTWAGQALASG